MLITAAWGATAVSGVVLFRQHVFEASFSGFSGDYIPKIKKMLKLALLKTKLFDCHTYWLVKLTPNIKRPRGHRCFLKKKFSPHVSPVAASGLIAGVCVGMELIQTV